ncbi:ribosome biogenesis protein WDR12 homolog [Elysia marginata]|uniref:Ribosome biogenesis protein WDR12 homolog n=1 Tax=Elysia marginata TaxID=1093978 RepID=A0AAV4J7C6_9GAST|nr:ribosome biogenesis protein WDR12 homolog [Elysia marginata]
MASSTPTLASTSHIQAKFFTKQTEYAIPDVPYSLPVNVSPKELNDIIYSVLYEGETEKTAAFDFLIHGELLRSSLDVYLEDKEISTESVFEIEYIERQAAPRPETSLSHDDWVSCVRGNNNLIACGCYDNTVKLWTRDGHCLTTIPGHSGPVKCVTWLKNTDEDDEHLFASGSHDQTAFVWRWKAAKKEIDCLYALRGHSGSVDCIAVNEDGERVVTGSWDKTIKLWTANNPSPEEKERDDSESAHQPKKIKSSGHKMITRVPLLTLGGHKEAVSSALWLDDSNVCTASWDHTLRTWDMSRAEQTQILEGSKAFFQIAHSPLSNLIVSASADRHVRLHDLRTKEMKGTYTSHAGWVSSVDWSKSDEHLFVSGSHDCLMKLWDTRSPKAPLYNMIGQEEKILAVDWSIPDLMLSGGVEVILFADDLALLAQNEDLEQASSLLQQGLECIEKWSKKWKMTLNVDKCEVTHFSKWTKEASWGLNVTVSC